MHLLIELTLFSCLATKAQTLRVSTQSYEGLTRTDSLWFTDSEYVNYVFGNLNFTEVSSNFLLQRSLSYFNPVQYDGKNSNDTTIRNTRHGMGIYNTFYYAALDTAANYAPTHPLLVSQQADSFNQQGYIPIVLLNRNYHSIKPDALLNNLFTTNIDSTILYDNPSRTVSPYQLHRIFMAFPYMNGSYRSYGDVKFKIAPSTLHFTDTLASQLQIDFGDGKGYINVDTNATRTVYYSASGIKTIKVKQGGMESISELNFVKKDVFYQTSEFIIPPEEENLMRNMSMSSVSQPLATSFLGCDNVLDKPIIIVEGFAIQPNDNANAEDVLNTLDLTLRNRLMNLGYDFVVVQFSNNVASIYENAQALQRAIIAINAQKTGTNKLHVIGLSMGGLIAKYCLKDMEDNNIDHNVENYFSYDSPHQGAYVPLGLQQLLVDASYAVKNIRNDEQVKFIMSRLNSDAGKQLLQLHYDGVYNSTRSSFASTYAAKGYPVQCNNYGIANGSGDGIGLNYAAGAQLMDFYGYVTYGILGKVLKHTQQLWSINTTQSKISYLSNKGIATFLAGLTGVRNYTSSTSFTGELIHETLPGSIVGMHTEYGDGLANNFREQGGETHDYFGHMFTSFVPTVSALDLNNQNYSQNGRYLSRNPYYDIASNHATVLSSHITPFDDIIYATDENQEHLRDPNGDIGRFIFEKIYGTTMPTGCGGLCTSTPTFSGLTNICGNGEATITMSNAPSGVIITWVVPPALEIIEGQGTNVIKVRTNSVGSFNAYVTLTWPGCTSTNYPFTVTYTQPIPTISGSLILCDEETYTISNLPTGATVTWSIEGWCAEVSSSSGNQAEVARIDYGSFKVKALVSTACGTIELKTDEIVSGFPYWVGVTDVSNDGMGTSYGILCSSTSGQDNYVNTFSYKVHSWASTIPFPLTLHYMLLNDQGVFYQSSKSISSDEGTVNLPNNIPSGFYDIEVWISGGACEEESEWYEEGVEVVGCGSFRMVVYPNPSNTELNIAYTNETNQSKSSKAITQNPFSVKLLNQKGKVLREGHTKASNAKGITLQVADIPNGIYYLHIYEGKNVSKQQVVIAH